MSFHKMGVVVEGINDNPPVFSTDHYEVEVEEERFPGLAVLTGNILFSEIFSLLIYFHLYFMKYFHSKLLKYFQWLPWMRTGPVQVEGRR